MSQKMKFLLFISLIILITSSSFLSPQNQPSHLLASNNLIAFKYNYNIWVVDPDSLLLTQITTDGQENNFYHNPNISNSGQYLAYEKRQDTSTQKQQPLIQGWIIWQL